MGIKRSTATFCSNRRLKNLAQQSHNRCTVAHRQLHICIFPRHPLPSLKQHRRSPCTAPHGDCGATLVVRSHVHSPVMGLLPLLPPGCTTLIKGCTSPLFRPVRIPGHATPAFMPHTRLRPKSTVETQSTHISQLHIYTRCHCQTRNLQQAPASIRKQRASQRAAEATTC